MKYLKTITIASGFAIVGAFALLTQIKVWELEEKLTDSKYWNEKDLARITNGAIKTGIEALYARAINGESIQMPIAWRLEEPQLREMLDTMESKGVKESIGVMAYPMIEQGTNTLKIALVPYYKEGSKLKHYTANGSGYFGAYNFSAICPPAVNCIDNMDMLVNATIQGEVKNGYKFKGDSVFKK